MSLSWTSEENTNIFDGYSNIDTLQDYLNSINAGAGTQFPSTSSQPVPEVIYITETVWVPPTEATAGTPFIASTPTEVKYSTNKGWNSWARSVEELEQGNCYVFNCNNYSEGFCIGIGPSSALGQSISQFTHGLILDASGVKVYENGQVVATIVTNYSHISDIKVYYLADSTIVYVVVTDTDTMLVSSLESYTEQEAYIHGYIYSSDDKLLTSEIESGTVQFGSV